MQNIGIYMLIMALTTYMIRVIPIGFVQKKLENEWIQDFVFYIPYCVLSAMTFPYVLYSTTPYGENTHLLSAVLATVAAVMMSWNNKGLVKVAFVAVLVAIVVEYFLQYYNPVTAS